MNNTDFLLLGAKILKAYNATVAATCQKYGLNRTCFEILIYLKNNPDENTARSIVEKRGVKKAMASVAIERLCQMGYVSRLCDKHDRRIQRLVLNESAGEITALGLQMQQAFQARLFDTLTPRQQKEYEKTSQRLLDALNKMENEELI